MTIQVNVLIIFSTVEFNICFITCITLTVITVSEATVGILVGIDEGEAMEMFKMIEIETEINIILKSNVQSSYSLKRNEMGCKVI